jgi:hypothetical protein
MIIRTVFNSLKSLNFIILIKMANLNLKESLITLSKIGILKKRMILLSKIN